MFYEGQVIKKALFVFYLLNCARNAYCANILGLFTSHSASHLIVHMSLVKTLAEHGHNVTVVVTQKPKVNHENIHTIIMPPTEEQQQRLDQLLSETLASEQSLWTTLRNMIGPLKTLIDMQADVLKDERFLQLYNDHHTKFDLLILGYFFNTYQLGVAAKLKIPVIISWSASPMFVINALVGNPEELSYVPNINLISSSVKKMSFVDRTKNLLTGILFTAFNRIIEFRMENFYKSLFLNDDSFPSYNEVKQNVSLVFCNSHFSEGVIRPNVPAIVEIGGIQIKERSGALPKDLENALHHSSTHGAILFTLGSNVRSSNLKNETVQTIYKVLSNLNQTVIWKWENLTIIPGRSPNILYKKWLPQEDILAHPNVKLFITHAGKGGIAEALHHGVPMVAIPIFADQHGNADRIVHFGFGKKVHLSFVSEDLFKNTILDVLNNSSYKENAQKFAHLYRDRPLSARKLVTYWTDYVIRYKGAPHMQSALVHMNFIEYHNIDVLSCLLFVTFLLHKSVLHTINLIRTRFLNKPSKLKNH